MFVYEEMDRLQKKGRDNWDEEDWLTWAYIENMLAEVEYYEQAGEDG